MQEMTAANTALREAREAKGLTRERLAWEAKTSTSTVARMELRGHLPSAMTVARIARVLDVPMEQILGEVAA